MAHSTCAVLAAVALVTVLAMGARAVTSTLTCTSAPCNWMDDTNWSTGVAPGSTSNCTADVVVANVPFVLTLDVAPGSGISELCVGSLELGPLMAGFLVTGTGFGLVVDGALTIDSWTTAGAALALGGSATLSTGALSVTNAPLGVFVNGSGEANVIETNALSVLGATLRLNTMLTVATAITVDAYANEPGSAGALDVRSQLVLAPNVQVAQPSSQVSALITVGAGGSIVAADGVTIAPPISLDANAQFVCATPLYGTTRVLLSSLAGMGTLVGTDDSIVVVDSVQATGDALVLSSTGVLVTASLNVPENTELVFNGELLVNATKNEIPAVAWFGQVVLEASAAFKCMAPPCGAQMDTATVHIERGVTLDFDAGFELTLTCASFSGDGTGLFSGPVTVATDLTCGGQSTTTWGAQNLYFSALTVAKGATLAVGNISTIAADHDNGDAVLTVAAGGVVTVSGTDVQSRVSWANSGTVSLGDYARLLLSSGTADTVSVHGAFVVPDTADLATDLTVAVDAPWVVTGALRLQGGTLSVNANVSVSTTLALDGLVVLDFAASAPAVSAGSITISAETTLSWVLNGPAHTPVTVSGPAGLGGELRVCALVPLSTPVVLLTFTSASGNFKAAYAASECMQGGSIEVTPTYVKFIPGAPAARHRGLKGSEIAGIVVCVLVVALIAAFVIAYMVIRRSRRTAYSSINEQ